MFFSFSINIFFNSPVKDFFKKSKVKTYNEDNIID